MEQKAALDLAKVLLNPILNQNDDAKRIIEQSTNSIANATSSILFATLTNNNISSPEREKIINEFMAKFEDNILKLGGERK